jgi:hypothetical protein
MRVYLRHGPYSKESFIEVVLPFFEKLYNDDGYGIIMTTGGDDYTKTDCFTTRQ